VRRYQVHTRVEINVARDLGGEDEDTGVAELPPQASIETGPTGIARHRGQQIAQRARVSELQSSATHAALRDVDRGGELQRGIEHERASGRA
jgi:hypothetical protein